MLFKGFGALHKGGVNLETGMTDRGYWDIGETILETGFTPLEDLAGLPFDYGEML